MKEYILETCVDSVESAMAAAEGGADRLELCSNLIIGGTTPGPWLFEEIRKRSDIRIHALIRPRFGDFCYTDAEFSMIRNAVKDFRKSYDLVPQADLNAIEGDAEAEQSEEQIVKKR